MASFPCPSCGEERESRDAGCAACDWQPKARDGEVGKFGGSTDERFGFPHQAARWSWRLPLIGILTGIVGKAFPPLALMAIFMHPVGLLLAIIGLIGIAKYGRSRLLVDSLVGLVISGALCAVMVWGFLGVIKLRKALQQDRLDRSGSELFHEALKHSTAESFGMSGWVGTASLPSGHEMTVLGVPTTDPDVDQPLFESPVAVWAVGIDGTLATGNTFIDMRNVRLLDANGKPLATSLDHDGILGRAAPDSGDFLLKHRTSIHVGPGDSPDDMFVIFADDFDPKAVASAEFIVDGKKVQAEGSIWTKEKKRMMFAPADDEAPVP